MLKAIPRDYFDPSKGTLKLLWEEEWRGLGITQVAHPQQTTIVPTNARVRRAWVGSITRSMSRSHTFCCSSKCNLDDSSRPISLISLAGGRSTSKPQQLKAHLRRPPTLPNLFCKRHLLFLGRFHDDTSVEYLTGIPSCQYSQRHESTTISGAWEYIILWAPFVACKTSA